MSANEAGFFVDREPDSLAQNGQLISSSKNAGKDVIVVEQKKTPKAAKQVWVDEDDEKLEVNLLHVPRRKKLRKTAVEVKVSATEYTKRVKQYYANENAAKGTIGGWAKLPSKEKKKDDEVSDQEASDEEQLSEVEKDLSENVNSLLQSTRSLLTKRKRAQDALGVSRGPPTLLNKILNIQPLRHANYHDRCQAEARCVEFHPSGSLLLAAGLDKTLRIFQVEGRRSTKVQSVHVQDFPIHRAKFTGGGTEIIMTSRRRFFFQMDLESGTSTVIKTLFTHPEKSWENFEVSADGSKLGFVGQYGKVVIMDNKSKREIGQLRHNWRVANLAFAPSGDSDNHLYSATVDGTIHLWDVRKMSCVDAHKDEGATHVTSLAVSSKHYAVGSDSGILNVYPVGRLGTGGGNTFGIRTEKPEKVFENLTTDIDNVTFNCDGQLMVFASHAKKSAVRIAHTPSMSVYTNWPSAKLDVRHVCSLAFSPKGGYLAAGNDKGFVHLIRIKAYPPS